MKTLLTTILFFFISASSEASLRIEYSTDLPQEFQYLLKSFEIGVNKKQNEKPVEELETLIQMMNLTKREELYLILKPEIYKSILETPPRISGLSPLNIKKDLLDKKLKKLKESGPFVEWMAKSLYSDFQRYKAKTTSTTKLTLPWLIYIQKESPEQIAKTSLSLLSLILKRIHKKLKIYIELSNFKKTNQLDYIRIVKNVSPVAKKKSDNITDISNQAIDDLSKDLDPSSLSVEELFPKPDPDYKPPGQLPKPAQSW
ncbi:MAG: hypothetical protein ACPGJV_07385 [Bacteriovoracaceae bacterium]